MEDRNNQMRNVPPPLLTITPDISLTDRWAYRYFFWHHSLAVHCHCQLLFKV